MAMTMTGSDGVMTKKVLEKLRVDAAVTDGPEPQRWLVAVGARTLSAKQFETI